MGRDPSPFTSHRANRRRLLVFLGTLVAALVVSLSFTWLRPAEYRASARIEITPGTESATFTSPTPAGSVEIPAPESARPFLTEIQVLTSRPVLEAAVAQLERAGEPLPLPQGSDPIADLQSRLEAIAVPNTNVVELVATGPAPKVLAPLLTAIIEGYRNRLAETFRDSSAESVAQLREEVEKLGNDLASKRRELEAFRARYNIVSLERDENVILAQTRSLGASLGTANENVAKAEGKLRALTESAAAGTAVKAKDDPTLANLEQRASQLREQLQELSRDFTPHYLAQDPKATAARSRLTELERQIKVQREVGRSNALAEAREEFATAQATVARIQSQIAAGQKELGQFTARFNEYKSELQRLNAIEGAHQDASRRLAKSEATIRARTPTLKVLEAAATPREPWRPNYWRDTALSIVGSFLLALLMMWVVELFNRSEARPSVVVLQGQAGGIPDSIAGPALGWQGAQAALGSRTPALLPLQPELPRELGAGEVAALVQASDDNTRLVVLLLLSGISPEEALALRWSNVDRDKGRIHVDGEATRDVALHDPLLAQLAERPPAPGSELVLRASSRDAVNAQLLCGAHDAGIENAVNVTPECVRHTYIAFLVRQGIRFADLTSIVGQLPAEVLGAYSALSPRGPRVSVAEINVVFPIQSAVERPAFRGETN